jgi:thymidylate synthase
MILISGNTRAEAWLKACNHLHQAGGTEYNVIMEVKDPTRTTQEVVQIGDELDAFLDAHRAQPNITVADTIFPSSEYVSGGLEGVYAYPDTIYPNISTHPGNNWGTYALRLTRRHAPDGNTVEPLKLLIEKLKRQLKLSGPKRAAYELDAHLEPMSLALYDPTNDHKNVIGGQCLSHISLKLGPNRELYMTALYRLQYFVQKAFGNLLGLAHLQACIAREVGIPVGPLVCHATLAVLEEGDGKSGQRKWKLRDVKSMLARCDEALSVEAE